MLSKPCLSCAYIFFPPLFMFWRLEEDCLLRKLNNFKLENPFSNTLGEGLHTSPTSACQEALCLSC